MAALRENNRMVVYYAGVLGFSRAEIAASTDCPIGTVMSRLHRGRKRLCTNLIAAAARRGFRAAIGRAVGSPRDIPLSGADGRAVAQTVELRHSHCQHTDTGGAWTRVRGLK